MKHAWLSFIFTALIVVMPAAASASGGGAHLEEANISLDQETLRKGLEVFTDVCMGCHSAKYVTYRGLMDYPEIGLTREQVDELRGDKALLSGLLTELSPEDAAESYGKVPPDLSVIAPGRRGGGNYIYSLMLGYDHDPDGKIEDGNYNKVFPVTVLPCPIRWPGWVMMLKKLPSLRNRPAPFPHSWSLSEIRISWSARLLAAGSWAFLSC